MNIEIQPTTPERRPWTTPQIFSLNTNDTNFLVTVPDAQEFSVPGPSGNIYFGPTSN